MKLISKHNITWLQGGAQNTGEILSGHSYLLSVQKAFIQLKCVDKTCACLNMSQECVLFQLLQGNMSHCTMRIDAPIHMQI